MDNYPSFSIKDTRNNLSRLVDQADLNHKSFIITKFGRPKALLSPFQPDSPKPRDYAKILKKYAGRIPEFPDASHDRTPNSHRFSVSL